MYGETIVTFDTLRALRVKGRGGEMVGSSESSSVKRSSEDKQPSPSYQGKCQDFMAGQSGTQNTKQDKNHVSETRNWSPPSKEIKES